MTIRSHERSTVASLIAVIEDRVSTSPGTVLIPTVALSPGVHWH